MRCPGHEACASGDRPHDRHAGLNTDAECGRFLTRSWPCADRARKADRTARSRSSSCAWARPKTLESATRNRVHRLAERFHFSNNVGQRPGPRHRKLLCVHSSTEARNLVKKHAYCFPLLLDNAVTFGATCVPLLPGPTLNAASDRISSNAGEILNPTGQGRPGNARRSSLPRAAHPGP